MTSQANSKQGIGRSWVQGTAFLPLLLLPAAKALVVSSSLVQTTSLSIALLFALILAIIAVPCLQITGVCLMLTYSRQEISTYRKWMWLVNVVVCWTVLYADPTGWLRQLADVLD